MDKTVKVNQETAVRRAWGDDGTTWEFLSTDRMSVFFETVGVGTFETFHVHPQTDQFFFVISGELEITLDQSKLTLGPTEGLLIKAGSKHLVGNTGLEAVRFLVVSSGIPSEDRTEFG